MHKKLMRSREHRVVSGVLGGFGTYYDIDPVLLRVLFVLFVLVTGIFPGVIGYIIAAYLMPEEPFIVDSKPLEDLAADMPGARATDLGADDDSGI